MKKMIVIQASYPVSFIPHCHASTKTKFLTDSGSMDSFYWQARGFDSITKAQVFLQKMAPVELEEPAWYEVKTIWVPKQLPSLEESQKPKVSKWAKKNLTGSAK